MCFPMNYLPDPCWALRVSDEFSACFEARARAPLILLIPLIPLITCDRITKFLGGESAKVPSPGEIVERILVVGRLVETIGHSIGVGFEDEPRHLATRTILPTELAGQPVQELRMSRLGAEGTEVVARPHDSTSEEMLTETIRGDSPGHSIVLLDQPVREGEPQAARFPVGGWFRSEIKAAQDCGHAGRAPPANRFLALMSRKCCKSPTY